jgi:hypothetical protein
VGGSSISLTRGMFAFVWKLEQDTMENTADKKLHVTSTTPPIFPQLLPAPIPIDSPIHQNQFLRRSVPSFYLSQTIYHVANSRCALLKQHARKTSRKCMIYCNCTLPVFSCFFARLPLHSAEAAKAIDTSQMSVFHEVSPLDAFALHSFERLNRTPP